MSNILDKNVTLTLFGESHGPCVGATIDGLPSGIQIDEQAIKDALTARRPAFTGETPRIEADDYEILSGVFHGKSTGEPLTIIIKNSNTKSKDYDEVASKYRPNHADFVANIKYQGNEDYRGGGHFSGRISTAIVAIGAIVQTYLETKGIQIGAHISQLGSVLDSSFNPLDPSTQIEALKGKAFPLLDIEKEEAMKAEMEKVAAENDSIGGAVEVVITGLSVGLGGPWFNRFDGALANALLSVGGVRGVHYGDIATNVGCKGSTFNDPFANENGTVRTKSNHSGGLQGGMSNGMPVLVTALIKPTPSIGLAQDTVTKSGENTTIALSGRHDPCIVRRITPVLKAMAALVAIDFYVGEFGRR